MSKVIKGVKKAFKKVVKVVKKVAPVVLAAAAVYFTAGAALGVAGAAGGWGAAAGSMTSALGSGTLGSVVTGAVTQAGYGAAIGGITAAATGGDVMKGMKRGAAAGAVTGGTMGLMRGPAAAAPQGGDIAAAQDAAGNAGINPVDASAFPGRVAEGGTLAGTRAAETAASAPGSAVAQAGGGAGDRIGGLFRKGGWLERNQDLVGKTVSGLGQGLMASAEADAYRDRYKQIRRNYGGADPGESYSSFAPGDARQTPSERFGPTGFGQFEYQYNPKSGRIERVPVG